MANKNDSFITLHRRITQWGWYTDGNTMRVFLHLILLANHKETMWREEVIERGQVLIGRIQLARDLKLSEQQIRTSLSKLKSTNEITIRATNKYSVVTVNNYNTYQDKKAHNQPAKQPTIQPTDNQQVTTSNNDNNDNKKIKSKETASVSNPGFSEDFMVSVWAYFAKRKKGPYLNNSTQGIALRQLFELCKGEEEVARKAIRETLSNNYQGYTWFFERLNRGNNGTGRNRFEGDSGASRNGEPTKEDHFALATAIASGALGRVGS